MSKAELPIVIVEAAEVEAAEAFDWYRARAGDAIAHRFRLALRRAVEGVRANPARYPRFDGNVRRCLFGSFPYAVLYEATDIEIVIIAFMHMKRRPGYWRRR